MSDYPLNAESYLNVRRPLYKLEKHILNIFEGTQLPLNAMKQLDQPTTALNSSLDCLLSFLSSNINLTEDYDILWHTENTMFEVGYHEHNHYSEFIQIWCVHCNRITLRITFYDQVEKRMPIGHLSTQNVV